VYRDPKGKNKHKTKPFLKKESYDNEQNQSIENNINRLTGQICAKRSHLSMVSFFLTL
jgi:hypothetical protein